MQVLTIQEDDKEVVVTAKERFTVTLRGIPSTGYTWVISQAPEYMKVIGDNHKQHDSELLELGVSSEVLGIEEKANEDPELCGGSYDQVFVFEIGKNFTGGELCIDYLRPWESGAPVDTFTVQLRTA